LVSKVPKEVSQAFFTGQQPKSVPSSQAAESKRSPSIESPAGEVTTETKVSQKPDKPPSDQKKGDSKTLLSTSPPKNIPKPKQLPSLQQPLARTASEAKKNNPLRPMNRNAIVSNRKLPSLSPSNPTTVVVTSARPATPKSNEANTVSSHAGVVQRSSETKEDIKGKDKVSPKKHTKSLFSLFRFGSKSDKEKDKDKKEASK
jgi:hypothetical protein